MRRRPVEQINVVVSTHTTRHLRRTLMGVAYQQRHADRVVVSVDNDDRAIAAVADEAAREFDLPMLLTQRPFAGVGRLPQVRNNGIRALLSDGGIPDDALMVFLDGDSCPRPDLVCRYAEAALRGDVLLGWRVYLDAAQTEAFDERALREGRPPARIAPQMLRGLRKRRRRYLKHRLLKPFGLVKPHKPKLLGGNHAIRWPLLRAINGYNEMFQGWGRDDDDLGRRAYRAGGRPVIRVTEILVYHQDHPIQPKDDAASTAARDMLAGPFEIRCVNGLENPLPQAAPTVRRLAGDSVA